MERGEANPTVDVLDRLAETLGVGLVELFADTEAGAMLDPGLPRGRKPK